MALKFVRFVGVFLTGIITGIYAYSVLAGAATKRLSGPVFTEMFQEGNPDFARIMPIVGMSSLAADAFALVLDRKVRSRPFLLTGTALALNIGATVATVRLNVPNNDEVMTWERDALPPHWHETRDHWLAAGKVRTAVSLIDLACLILAMQSDTKRG